MFEDVVLQPAAVRPWAIGLGLAGELLAAGVVLAVPLIWPQLLPRAEIMTWLAVPTPPPALKKPALRSVRPARTLIPHPALRLGADLVEAPAVVLDQPPLPAPGVDGGSDAVPGSRFQAALDSVLRAAEPRAPAAVPETRTAPSRHTAAPVTRIRVGGTVQAARLIHRVDPVYPALARQMRLAGRVELTGIIGTDGRIRELKVVGGHPLLIPATLDAVRQLVYQPTLLGGEPVEVITTITVDFRLR